MPTLLPVFSLLFFAAGLSCWLNGDASSGEWKLNIQTLLKTGIWSFWFRPNSGDVKGSSVCVSGESINLAQQVSLWSKLATSACSTFLMLAALNSADLTYKLLLFMYSFFLKTKLCKWSDLELRPGCFSFHCCHVWQCHTSVDHQFKCNVDVLLRCLQRIQSSLDIMAKVGYVNRCFACMDSTNERAFSWQTHAGTHTHTHTQWTYTSLHILTFLSLSTHQRAPCLSVFCLLFVCGTLAYTTLSAAQVRRLHQTTGELELKRNKADKGVLFSQGVTEVWKYRRKLDLKELRWWW